MQPHKVQTADKPLRLRTRLIISMAAFLIRIWFSTCRVKITGCRYFKRFFIDNESAVGATWHRGAVFLVWYFGRFHPIIMFSKSADGDLLAGFAAKMGVIPVRGSSSRGGGGKPWPPWPGI